MNEHDQLVAPIVERKLSAFARYDLKELIENYDDFEEATLDGVTELCATYLLNHGARVAGNVVVISERPYHWNLGYNSQTRTLSLVVLPEYESKAKHRIRERDTRGIGRVLKISLVYVSAVDQLFLPLLEACCDLVLRSHALLRASLLGSIRSYRNNLLEGVSDVVKAWAAQSNVSLADCTYAFSVSNRDTIRFNYSLTSENIDEAITRCNAAQILGASPFELTTALLTTEMQDAVIQNSKGEIPPITIVPYVTLKSMETNYEFWSGEHLFLSGAALAAIDVGSHRNYVLQLNITASAKELGTRIINENRQLLLMRFKANVEEVTSRFGGISRFVRKVSRGISREASVEFLSDLFWRVIQKGTTGGG